MSANPPLAWVVTVTREHESRWRDTLGQESIDAWCDAHGWRSKDVCCDSVVVFGYTDGRAYVNAELMERDRDDKPIWDERRQGARRRAAVAPLLASLPEGIGHVDREETL